jgi:hypothetical protein
MSDLKLFDAVTLKATGGMPAMDGVVAYLDPNNQIEIGVRLTGSSVGLGDHSGSVDGIDYFDCPLNSGLLVNRDELEIRQLSRIQELRLKRELAAGQLDMSRSHTNGSSSTSRSKSTQNKPPSVPNQQAIAPKTAPPSVSLEGLGLSPTALDRLNKLNQTYMQETIGPAAANGEEELLISDDEHAEEEAEQQQKEEKEEYLQINREHVSRLRQRKEEIQRRKEALKQGTSSTLSAPTDEEVETGDPDNNNIAPIATPAKEEDKTLSRLEELQRKQRHLEGAPVPPPSAFLEQVPWPDTNDTAPAVPQASPPSVPEAVVPEDKPMSRLEQLKMKKRKLEGGGGEAPPVTSTIIKHSEDTNGSQPTQPPQHDEPSEEEPIANDTTTATTATTTAAAISTTATDNTKQQLKVQIINSASKRTKELPVEISDRINVFEAIYDNPMVKQANIRKWGTSFVQQVREKKSVVTCRIALIPDRQQVVAEQEMHLPMDLSIDQLKELSTQDLYRKYATNYNPNSSIIQMVLLCQPIQAPETESSSMAPPSPPSPPQASQTESLSASAAIPAQIQLQVQPQQEQQQIQQEQQQPQPQQEQQQIQQQQQQREPKELDEQQEPVAKYQLRVKVSNDTTKYFKDLLVETSDKMNLYESIYNNPGVKQARVRKWSADTVDQVRHGMAEIVCQICTVPNGKPEHLVKHGALTIEQLRETTTEELYTKYAIDHYDPNNDKSLVQIILQCQQIKTPLANNSTNVMAEPAAPKPIEPSFQTDRGTKVEAATNELQQTYERSTDEHETRIRQSSSFNSMDRKDTAKPYAVAASVALPIHDTETTFSDLLEKPETPKKQEEPVVKDMVEVSLDDAENGTAEYFYPSPARTADAEVQTFEVETLATTPTTDNRRPRPQRQRQTKSFSQQLQEVDAFWWIAIICILAAAFFAALFLGPVE